MPNYVIPDHKIAELVCELTNAARRYKDCQSLRGVLSGIVTQALLDENPEFDVKFCYRMWDKEKKSFYMGGKLLYSNVGHGRNSISHYHNRYGYQSLTKEEQRERYTPIKFKLVPVDLIELKELQN